MIFGITTPILVANLRVGVFNALFIDYLTVSIRTLGHYPTNPKTTLNSLGFILASLNLTAFVLINLNAI